MLVCLVDDFILGFCYSKLIRETSRFELASTINLALQANRRTKCASLTVLFAKTKEMSMLIYSHFNCVQFLQFSAENMLRLFKNKSRRACVDQNDIKFVFCMKNCFWVHYNLNTKIRSRLVKACNRFKKLIDNKEKFQGKIRYTINS